MTRDDLIIAVAESAGKLERVGFYPIGADPVRSAEFALVVNLTADERRAARELAGYDADEIATAELSDNVYDHRRRVAREARAAAAAKAEADRRASIVRGRKILTKTGRNFDELNGALRTR
jgi:hypothetical protein